MSPFSSAKLFHAYGLGNGLDVRHDGQPQASAILARAHECRPTLFFSVPTHLAAMLRETDAGCPYDIYISNRPPGVRPGSSGVPGYDVRITDERGRELPAGETGDLCRLFRRPEPAESRLRAGLPAPQFVQSSRIWKTM